MRLDFLRYSIRVRLLVLALAPLVLLAPFLLFLGMTRWTGDYDKVLIANVASDLRIAEQYLARIMTGTGVRLNGTASSAEFAEILTGSRQQRDAYVAESRQRLGLDFLYFLSWEQAGKSDWPVIQAAARGESATQIDIFDQQTLQGLDPELARQARIDLIATEAAVPTERTVEDRGMVLHSASPVNIPGQRGVLVGGLLLNRNLEFIDTINALVYLNAVTGGERQGTATLFLEDVRVSTNVRLFEDVRALGTRVSAVVRQAVLGEGQTWLNRAFVVNDWYISGYVPLIDSFDQRVGMLYVGFLEAPFAATKRAAYLWMILAFAVVLAISAPIFLWMAKGIFAPLEHMTQTMRRVGEGDLSARNNLTGTRDELGQVAAHLDDLLDQVQDRDVRLRSWAEELNDRVDQRTAELREANEKLDSTWRQLVMSEKLASIGEITAGVAHEINNPVAVIQGNVDVIREGLGEEADHYATELTLVDQQVMRIQGIVGKLLTFAQPGEYAEHDEVVDLHQVVRDCLVLVDHILSKGAIHVSAEFEEAPLVRADPAEIQQVVINLIVNATQAMGNQGALSLRLAPHSRDGQHGAGLVVRDTGPGIAPDKIDAVFDPFFTTKQAEGTGLGLSISQTIVQRFGGLITVRNMPDGGAEFLVWLPAASPQEVAAQ